MLEIVDSFAEGIFAGQKIIKPEDAVKKYPDATVIVSTLSGRESAETFLQQHGKISTILLFTKVYNPGINDTLNWRYHSATLY